MSNLKQYEDDFWNFIEAGFVATNHMDGDSAEKLFMAAHKLKPEHTFPTIGFGYMQLCRLQAKDAVASFQRVLDKEPENEMAKALLAIAKSFTLLEMDNADKMLEELSRFSEDKDIKKLAEIGSNFLNQHLKAQPGPADPNMRKQKER
ncbi:MAG: hypothetical protein A3F09_01520 [Chlamydiae bacterium RIFCSPHIGHO2_12_FULL_49_11]|nr:MAG: hypothetical protein A3F09_01520 [Chlamydiae bacterium RIFCSPHIGHO2_12_FULL_49_11]